MACEVNFVVNHEQQHQTEEERMEAMWLDLVRTQTNYCLRIMEHVQTPTWGAFLGAISSFFRVIIHDHRLIIS